jgi:hypothetical protein
MTRRGERSSKRRPRGDGTRGPTSSGRRVSNLIVHEPWSIGIPCGSRQQGIEPVTGADQDDGSNNLSFFMVGAYIMAIAALTIYNRCFGWAVQLAPCDPDGTSKAVSRHVHSLTLAVHILSAESRVGARAALFWLDVRRWSPVYTLQTSNRPWLLATVTPPPRAVSTQEYSIALPLHGLAAGRPGRSRRNHILAICEALI